jgi:predicted deacylase
MYNTNRNRSKNFDFNCLSDRPMIVAKICSGGCRDSRPAMWVDAGIHANEWTGPATLMYLIRELVENNDAHPHLTEKLDWYLLPTLNPDGYAYTRENSKYNFFRGHQ